MGDQSTIEWTDATWNVATGCTKVSPGCANCYIERTPPFRVKGRTFEHGTIPLLFHEDRLALPLRWRRPRRIFVNSLSDMFHEDMPDALIGRMFGVMAEAHWHQFQVLTKREARLVAWSRGVGHYPEGNTTTSAVPGWPRNVWVGVTAENRRWVEQRGMALLDVEAQVRWLSIEPVLEDVAWQLDCLLDRAAGRLHWVVLGFESGPRRRPMAIGDQQVALARRVRDVCAAHGVPFLFKQWGGLTAKRGGRLLDGRTHDEYPDRPRPSLTEANV